MRPETIPAGDKRNVTAWAPVVVYCALIFIQSSFATSSRLGMFPGMDKLLHFGGYGLLGLLFMRAFTLSASQPGTIRVLCYSILLTALYGISDEVHQSFVPARTADMMDAVADALGGACGVLLYYIRNRGLYHRAK